MKIKRMSSFWSRAQKGYTALNCVPFQADAVSTQRGAIEAVALWQKYSR